MIVASTIGSIKVDTVSILKQVAFPAFRIPFACMDNLVVKNYDRKSYLPYYCMI